MANTYTIGHYKGKNVEIIIYNEFLFLEIIWYIIWFANSTFISISLIAIEILSSV